MDSIIQLVKALAWPLTVFFLVIILRKKIRDVFNRLSRFKYKDLEAEFERDLSEAESRETSLPPIGAEQVEYRDQNYERLLEIARLSPRAAILEAWIEVERAFTILTQNAGLTHLLYRMPTYRAVQTSVEQEIIPRNMNGLYQDLRILRNRAAHEEDFTPSIRQVERYLSLTLQLAAALQSLQRNISRPQDAEE